MDLTFRYNENEDDVEIVVDDTVVDTVGSDVFASWARAYNDKHGYIQPKEVEKPETVTEEKPVEEEAKPEAEAEDKPAEETKDD